VAAASVLGPCLSAVAKRRGFVAGRVISVVRQVMAGHGGVVDDIDAARSWLKGRQDCTGMVGVPTMGVSLPGQLATRPNSDSMVDGSNPGSISAAVLSHSMMVFSKSAKSEGSLRP
jgi:hypothetical protein